MDYLTAAMKIEVAYEGWIKSDALPYLITDRYKIRTVYLNGTKALFVYPQTELEQVAAVKKHLERIRALEDVPAVLILTRLSARQRQYLIQAGIPFVVEEKQIYLPFMGALLSSKCDPEPRDVKKLTPSAQMLLLYYLYRCKKQLPMSEAVTALGFSAMTISRAARQLCAVGLITTYKEGKSIIIESEKYGEELFRKAAPLLASPVRRCIYVPRDAVSDGLPLAGYSALSQKTMLNPPQVLSYASARISDWGNHYTNRLMDAETQVCIEVWTYDPAVLSHDGAVDTLSLSLALKEDKDERVEECAEEMMCDFWREYNG